MGRMLRLVLTLQAKLTTEIETNFLKVVDTPGFGDSEGRDNEFIVEMMDVLKNELGYTNLITLVLEGSTPRFGEALYNMLRQMTSIFGNDWWDFMVVGVSKWSYSQVAINTRNMTCTNYPDRCQDEAWFINEFNAQFQEKFGLTKNFTFAFVDSWSQTIPNNEDPIQQMYWKQETDKLWEAATSTNETFPFMSIDDVLEDNAACRDENLQLEEENKMLNDQISEEIESIKAGVELHEDAISILSSTATINSMNIESNTLKTEDNSNKISNVSTTFSHSIEDLFTNMTNNIQQVSNATIQSIDEVSKHVYENSNAGNHSNYEFLLYF